MKPKKDVKKTISSKSVKKKQTQDEKQHIITLYFSKTEGKLWAEDMSASSRRREIPENVGYIPINLSSGQTIKVKFSIVKKLIKDLSVGLEISSSK